MKRKYFVGMGKYIVGILLTAFLLLVFLHIPKSEFPYKALTGEEIRCITVNASVADYVMTPFEAEELVVILNGLSHYGYAGAYEAEEKSGATFLLEYSNGQTELIGVKRSGQGYYLIRNDKVYEMDEEIGRHLAAVHQEYVSMRYEMSAERPYEHLDVETIKEILVRTPEGDYDMTSSEMEGFVDILKTVSYHERARYYGSSVDANVMFCVEYTDGREEYIWVIEPWYFVVNGVAYEIEVEMKEQIEHLPYVD